MSTAFFNAAPRKSLVTHVEDEIRAALIEGRLEPGTRLVTKDLAESLGMSITPVREALVRFAASGVLTAEPAQSFRVPTMTVAQYSEIAEIRKSVEGLAAFNAATQISGGEIAEMQALLKKYLVAKAAKDQHLALTLNKEFRFVLYTAARMPTLLGVIEMLWLKAGPGFNYLYPEAHSASGEHHNYDDLMQALSDKQAGAARAAIEHAIEDGARIVIEALQQREEQLVAVK
ncbi:GntR family transcriptional regulator, colanic acid and biofilm gene transcriptional regulator [Rhizobium sp. NFR07]|uniref:FCD domain-containing protein n=1 Tax=Rhizobium sp. NFR07 TaxID=1566262 RepID=UPI0008E29B2A|nr:FCD domain-containing protein [Rhizobium sp. NFR07]SFB55829.1 GntR family transcriptional regulator, colanic acid and biofilm gene transcriptional regulator [Rhizobium sp. NFR07]